MSGNDISSANFVVSRPVASQQPSPTYYEDDVLTSIYFMPRLPFSLPTAQWFLGVAEFLVLASVIFVGIVIIILFKHSKSQYKCPNCGESFCFYNMTPENCKNCGHSLVKQK